jgi:hypothetical protein
VDPLGRSATITNPQSFNRYSYVLNSPTNLTDPLGLMAMDQGMDHNGAEPSSSDDDPPGDPFEKGSDIVAAAMAKFDGRVADTIFANGLNKLIRSGRMTRDQAEEAIKGNDNLQIEEVTSSVSETQDPLIPNQATNPEDYYLTALLLGEATSWGQVGVDHEYGINQSGQSNVKANGPLITEDTAMREMIYMVSVIINRMGASQSGNSIRSIVTSGEFAGFGRGERLLNHGGAPHRQLAFARAAIDWVREHGSAVPENVRYWKAVQQGNGIRSWRPGIDWRRVGGTDFSTQN